VVIRFGCGGAALRYDVALNTYPPVASGDSPDGKGATVRANQVGSGVAEATVRFQPAAFMYFRKD
jgi:hypothetical protein